jgi:proline iminopeptidase
MTRDLRRVHPEAWDRFVSAVPESMRDLPLADVYATLLFDPDPIVRERAALEWCLWDNAQMGRPSMPARFDDPDFRLRIARLVTHYWRNGAFLDEDQLLRDAPKLNGIPGVLIHGRNDISCPLDTAWHCPGRGPPANSSSSTQDTAAARRSRPPSSTRSTGSARRRPGATRSWPPRTPATG